MSFSLPTRSARLLGLVLALALTGPAVAQVDLSRDLLGSDLFPPDLILREADSLELTAAQRDAITSLVRSMKVTMGEEITKLRQGTQELRTTLHEPTSDAAVLEQFAALLEAEKKIKQGQFAMLLRARNLLTPPQREKLREIVRQTPPKGPPKGDPADARKAEVRQELDARMQKVQSAVERWRKEGRDPAPILNLMRNFGQQMQAGQFPEAKETLNRALERLQEPP